MICARRLPRRRETIMATPKTLQAINSRQALEKTAQQLPPERVKTLLKNWFKNLTNPSRREGETSRDVEKYFDLLQKALQDIYDEKTYPPSLEKPYIEELRSKKNPYDFAKTLELAVDGTLHFEEEIDPKTTFFLHHFHRRQLEKAWEGGVLESREVVSTNRQIGRIWA